MKPILSLAITLLCLILVGCSGNSPHKKLPITDGFECIVTAKGENSESRLSIKRNGESYKTIFLNEDGSRGTGMTVSPNGCAIEIFGLLKRIDFDYLSDSLPGLIYTALNHNYTSDKFDEGSYFCNDVCGDYILSIADDGTISSIKFLDYNYICYFDYRTA